MKKVLLVFGTRPEAIKMCPVINELKKRNNMNVVVCVTGQHRKMLDTILNEFSVIPDYDLDIMKKSQSLFHITNRTLIGLEQILIKEKPDIVLMHGDTTTSFAVALSCFYMRIKTGHVEAGLRTYDLYSPYPEEFNRQSIDMVADYYFAPTEMAKENLVREGKNQSYVYVTGNTAIDALNTTVKKGYISSEQSWASGARLILMTVHRRENIGKNMENIFWAVRKIVQEFDDVKVLYPMHLNPEIRKMAKRYLGNHSRIHIADPLDMVEFHNLMASSYLIVTDSGGIQEEAPSFGVPVLVTRTTTERPEGIEAGTLKLVGVDRDNIYKEIYALLTNQKLYKNMCVANNPYGDGHASERIADILEKEICNID